MVYVGNITALSNSNIEKFAKNHPEYFAEKTLNKINDILLDLNKMLPNNSNVNKLLNSVNIPILVFNYDKYEQMIENNEITREEYIQFLEYWFTKGIYSSNYTQYIGSTPTNKIFVEGRINVIEEELINFIANIRSLQYAKEKNNENDNIKNNCTEGEITENKMVNIQDIENYNKKMVNSNIKNYLESVTSDSISEKTAMRILQSVVALKKDNFDVSMDISHFINYMNNLTDIRQKDFIKESIELISRINFKNIDDVIIPNIIKLYESIKTENGKSLREIEFHKWLNNLYNEIDYKELIYKLNCSEKNLEKYYSYLYDNFLMYLTLRSKKSSTS